MTCWNGRWRGRLWTATRPPPLQECSDSGLVAVQSLPRHRPFQHVSSRLEADHCRRNQSGVHYGPSAGLSADATHRANKLEARGEKKRRQTTKTTQQCVRRAATLAHCTHCHLRVRQKQQTATHRHAIRQSPANRTVVMARISSELTCSWYRQREDTIVDQRLAPRTA